MEFIKAYAVPFLAGMVSAFALSKGWTYLKAVGADVNKKAGEGPVAEPAK